MLSLKEKCAELTGETVATMKKKSKKNQPEQPQTDTKKKSKKEQPEQPQTDNVAKKQSR